MSLYQYRPLESKRLIRLLKLSSNTAQEATDEAGSPHDSIVAEIHHVRLDDANLPPYEPVSYVWAGYTPKSYINADESNTSYETPPSETSQPSDDAKRDQQITLESGEALVVSRSLLIALPCLKVVSTTRFLWIDQLSINQDDLMERSEQVTIMHEIYSRGTMTLIWLGEDTEDMKFLRSITRWIGSYPMDFCLSLGRPDEFWRDAWSSDIELLQQKIHDGAAEANALRTVVAQLTLAFKGLSDRPWVRIREKL
jgi:hypothetical protein